MVSTNLLGSLGIVDGDDVELGNLHRQVNCVRYALYFVYVVVVICITATGTLIAAYGRHVYSTWTSNFVEFRLSQTQLICLTVLTIVFLFYKLK
jgi:hypothetical protein